MTTENKSDRVMKDGKTAVLVSPGNSAGWSTWNSDLGEEALFCPDMVNAILSGESPMAAAERHFPDAYKGGVDDLQVEWVPVGSRFEISEYDGSESLRIFGDSDGFEA